MNRFLVLAFLACLSSSIAFAQGLGDLDDELFSDLDPGEEVTDVQLRRDLGGEGTPQGDAKPDVPEIAKTMFLVRDRLSRKDLAAETQELQGEVVSELDRIIEQLKKRPPPSSGGGGGGKSASKSPPKSSKTGSSKTQQSRGKSGAKQSSIQPVRPADPSENLKKPDRLLGKSWGHLPASVRQRMQSTAPEKFLPKYSKLIEDYFRRLAEED